MVCGREACRKRAFFCKLSTQMSTCRDFYNHKTIDIADFALSASEKIRGDNTPLGLNFFDLILEVFEKFRQIIELYQNF